MSKYDYNEYGGAPLLGVNGIVIGTMTNFSFARAGQRVATVKSAPFAIAQAQVEAVVSILKERGPFSRRGRSGSCLFVRRRNEGCFSSRHRQAGHPSTHGFVLRHVDELQFNEISETLNISVGTVKSRLHYGKQTLRHLIEEET
jgi:hypothetical protein